MKNIIFILLMILPYVLFSQTRVLITGVNKNYIRYDVYDGDNEVAVRQKFPINSYEITNTELRDSLLVAADSLLNLDIVNYKNISFNIGNDWTVVADSAKIAGNRLNVYYTIKDDTDASIRKDIMQVTNNQKYSRKDLKQQLIAVAFKYKNGALFVRSKQQFIGQFFQ